MTNNLYGAALLLKVMIWAAIRMPGIIVDKAVAKATSLAKFAYISAWDFNLFVLNCIQPLWPKGTVVKNPHVGGYKTMWPQFVAPTEQDSRGPCPGLNAMANHGIFPHSGRGIKLTDMAQKMHECFNFSLPLCQMSTVKVAVAFGRDTIDLGDLSTHNVVEHDASFVREDEYFQPDQRVIAKTLINKMLASASGPKSADHPKGYLTPGDISRWISMRRAQSKRDNPHYTMSGEHSLFGIDNSSVITEIFGGDVQTCETVLLEERFPDGFETFTKTRHGLTIMDFHLRSAEIFFGMRPMKL